MRHWLIAVALLGAAATHPAAAQDGPRIDVVFLLDATGSMQDEIDAVKDEIRAMISAIALGEPVPDVRFGLVAYRDRGDEYVTRAYPLTRDIDQVVDDLSRVEADGGGDTPESLNEGLHVALQEMAWDEAAARLVFLIADAPPHLDYADDYDWREEVRVAAERGIAVHAIGASGLDEEGERIFRDIAAGTQGQFQWLVYESRYVDQDGDEVVVRVAGREATADGAAPAATAAVSTTTNLDDLVTARIRSAAEAAGVDYEGDGTTAVESASWGAVKARAARR